MTEGDIEKQHTEITKGLTEELNHRKKMKLDLETYESERSTVIKDLDSKGNFLDALPNHLSKLSENLKAVQEYFKVSIAKHPDQVKVPLFLNDYSTKT